MELARVFIAMIALGIPTIQLACPVRPVKQTHTSMLDTEPLVTPVSIVVLERFNMDVRFNLIMAVKEFVIRVDMKSTKTGTG